MWCKLNKVLHDVVNDPMTCAAGHVVHGNKFDVKIIFTQFLIFSLPVNLTDSYKETASNTETNVKFCRRLKYFLVKHSNNLYIQLWKIFFKVYDW